MYFVESPQHYSITIELIYMNKLLLQNPLTAILSWKTVYRSFLLDLYIKKDVMDGGFCLTIILDSCKGSVA